MRLSTRVLCGLGLSLVTVVAVGCAQQGADDGGSPTSPSSVAGGPSATAAGPSATYDASGLWCVTNTDADGNVEGDPFESLVTQEPGTGDLLLTDEDGNPTRLQRVSNGQGATITYRLFFIGNEGGTACDFRAKGTLLLDTRTNTITGNLRLKQLGCENERMGAGVIGSKGSCPAD